MIVIIGASGFIGTYLADELIHTDYNILVTGRNLKAAEYYSANNIRFINIDISNKEDFYRLPQKDVEVVILLGALLPANCKENNPRDYIDININGTLNCLEYCRKIGVRKLISTTTYADVRGFWCKDTPLKSDCLRKYTLSDDHAAYVISKNAATDLILMYNEQFSMQNCIFRFPMVYGYGPHSELFVNGKWYKSGFQTFIDKAINGEDIEIFGDPEVCRDIVYIKDVVQAFVKAINSPNSRGLYNISSGIGLTLNKQVEITIDTFSRKKRSNIIYKPKIKNNSESFLFDISKASKDFGYMPKFTNFKDLLSDYEKEAQLKRFPHLENQYKTLI